MSVETPAYNLDDHAVVPHDEWIEARQELLAKEKEFTRQRDAISQARRDLPWERVEKTYVFDGPNGKQTLAETFGACSQLVVYHFMFDATEDVGCKHCSFWADNYAGISPHLGAHDVAFTAISRVPFAKIAAYKKRMGWSFSWLSSFDTDFNRDLGVTFSEDEIENGKAFYNYRLGNSPDTEREGISVFYKDANGAVFHTYSAYARGIDIVNGAYNFLDMTPKGRDEGDRPQFWIRRHDEYGT